MFKPALVVLLVPFLICVPAFAGTSPANSRATQVVGPIATAAPVGAPTGTTTVFVPKGTVIVVETTEGLSSYAAAPQEELDYQVAQDTVVNGYLIAKADDDASGKVLEAQQGRAGYYGIGYKAADLRIDVESVNNFCGDTLKVRFIRTEYRRREGLFGSKKDVGVDKGQKYAAVTAYPQKVCGVPTTEANPTVGNDVLQPDAD